jgi:hypothetical protein
MFSVAKSRVQLRLMIGVAAALAATAVSAQQPAGERKSRVAETYASRYNVSYEEALRRLKFQTQVGELDARLTEQEKVTLGGLYIEHKPTFRVVVKFTGANGTATLAKYTQDPAYVPAVAETAYSALLDIQNSLAATLKPLNIKAWTDIDIKAGRVKLYVPDPTVISAATLAGTVKLSPLVDVIKAVSTGGDREASIEGGRGINANGNLCTLGFTVRPSNVTETSTSPRYMLTAGHCLPPVTYNGVTLTRIGVNHNTATANDYSWWSVPSTLQRPTNVIWDGIPGYYLEILRFTPYANMSIGREICKYGAQTGYTCGNIASKNYGPVGSPNWFVRVHHPLGENMSFKGDSGGPYYDDYEYNAYGIHNDSAWNGKLNDSVFMPVNYISFSNLTVSTNP